MAQKFLVINSNRVIISVHNKTECAEKSAKKHSATVVESCTAEQDCKAGAVYVAPTPPAVVIPAPAPTVVATVAHIAKPDDSRCAWWAVHVPADVELNGEKITRYIKSGSDLELKHGDMLIVSEANYHCKNYGYITGLLVSFGDSKAWARPTSAKKAFIKAHGGQDLMRESGDVNACIRMAVWLRRQPDLRAAFDALDAA